MTTRRSPMSLEGTIEIIDLSHASEEEAARTVLEEIRARRARRPRAANGPAVMIDLDRGSSGGAGAAHDAAPRSRQGVPGSGQADGRHDAQPFSFTDFGELLRHLARAPEAAPAQESAGECAERTETVESLEQFIAERIVMGEDGGGGKIAAAAVVGFGLGAAAMYLARRLRYVAPPSAHRARPRRPHHDPDAAAWQAQLEEIERRYRDPSSDDEDDEPSLGE